MLNVIKPLRNPRITERAAKVLVPKKLHLKIPLASARMLRDLLRGESVL